MRYLHLFLGLILVGLIGSVAWAQIPIGGGGGSVRGSGSTGQCAEWSNSNTLEASGASCGSGATYPTGSPPQITGFSALNTSESETVTGDCTFTRAGANSYTIACTKSSGTAFGTAAFQNTGTSGANLPFMNGANTWSGVQSITNADLSLLGSSTGNTLLEATAAAGSGTIATFPANTGIVAELNLAQTWSAVQTYTNSDFKLLGSSTGATTFTSANAGASNFTLTFPAATDTVVDLAGVQTLTNKSIAGTEINSGIVGATYGGSGIASPTAHSLLMGEGSSAFNLITATTSGDFIIDQGSGSDFAEEAMSGDCTLTLTGAITCTKSSGSAFGTAAFDNTGTSGATIPLLNAANTWSAAQTFNNSDIVLLGSSTGATTFTSSNSSASNYTLTVPALTDTMTLNGAVQTLTNKNIDASEINSGTLTVGVGGTGATTFAAGKPLLGNGASAFNVGSLSGSTTVLATLTGAATSGDCVQFDALGNIESAGAVCGSGGGGGQPIYTHTLTESGGAATLVVQSSSVPNIDTNSMAMNGGATITTPASSAMADGEQVLLVETTTGTSYTTTFAAGSGTLLASIVLGDAGIGSATACGTIPATGTQWFKFQYSLFNTTLTLQACGVSIPPTSIASAVGGLGVANPTAHAVLVGEGSAPVTPVGPNSTTGLPLISQGSTSDPVFAALNLGGPGITGSITVATGGTGNTTLTAHSMLVGEGTSAVAFATPAATGVPLISNGSAADPSFAALSLSGAGVTGTLPVTSGGTNLTTLTAHAVVLGEGTSSVAFATPAATGVPLISQGAAGDPVFGLVTLTAGASQGITGTLPTTNGGSGRGPATAHAVLQGEGSNPFGQIAAATAGNIIVDQGSGVDWASEALSADCTLASTGAITCTKSNGTAFGTAAFQNTGTSGANVPLLNGTNTWAGVNTFSSAPVMSGASITANTVPVASVVTGTFMRAMSDTTALTSYGGL